MSRAPETPTKIVAVARVKNELDIIEPFVRHHAQHCHKVIVLDDGSTDGTYDLLLRLRASMLSLVVLREEAIGYPQNRYMTRLVQIAVGKFGADWVVPLDADEFIEPANGLILAEMLRERPPGVLELKWSNFAWSPDLETSEELNPVVRHRLRLPPRADQTKVIVHRDVLTGRWEIAQGNHMVLIDGEPIRAEPFDQIALCHYPVRSIAQYAKKIAVGYLQYAADPDWDRQLGWQYIAPFRTLADSGLQALTDRMICDSRSYGLPKGEVSGSDIQPRDRPLDYRGGALTFTPPRISGALEDVLRHAEKVVALAAENKRLAAAVETAEHEARCLRSRAARLESAALAERLAVAVDAAEYEAKYLRSRAARLELALLDAEERLCIQDRRLQSRTFRFITWWYALVLAAAGVLKRTVAGTSAASPKRSK